MAVAQGYGKTITSGSVFAFDTGDTRNSYSGRPTVNVSAGLGLNNYNNVPGNVSTSITTTGGTYKGAAIYQQTITPLDATGVSYLTNGNNPGIGVYHSGGGGTGGQYSGHTIFFKPTGPMHSSPIFTHYSNIGGWQSSTNYEDMGDGWFRAKVLWYSASTLSDQKFWAINPAGATANVPITIYWAGPFKENLNSTTISQFVEGTRSATQGLLPLVGNSSLDLTNVSFDSNAQMTFDGTNDYIEFPSVTLSGDFTVTQVVKLSATANGPMPIGGGYYLNGSTYLGYMWFRNGFNQIRFAVNGEQTVVFSVADSLWVDKTIHYAVKRQGTTATLYINGVEVSSGTATTTNFDIRTIGYSYSTSYASLGTIPATVLYNRALSAGEVRQNYLHYKTRFNLS